jgi:ATP-dependent Clp protease ATP-binding subunit ClpA
MIADEAYDADQGARSLKVAVESRITDELVKKYLNEEGNINELQPLARYVVDLSRNGDIYVRRAS